MTKRRIVLKLSYRGSDFNGWQMQRGREDARSVQATLESTLESLLDEHVATFTAGRTDAGVHALGQVVHFDTASPLPPRAIRRALNDALLPSVGVISAAEVEPTFDARRSAVLRTYTYRLVVGDPAGAVVARNLVGISYGRHQADTMRGAAELFRGDHEFQAFRSSRCQASRTRLTIQRAGLEAMSLESKRTLALPDDTPAWVFTVASQSFLMHMVRRMVGAIVLAGRGKLSLREIEESLKTGAPMAQVLLMPPGGLVLHRIDYPRDPFAAAEAALEGVKVEGDAEHG